MLARLQLQAVGVVIGNRHREVIPQFADCGIHRRGMREFRKDDQAHGQEGGAASHRSINHREHAIGVDAHAVSRGGIREIGLAGGSGVANMAHGRVVVSGLGRTSSSIGGSGRLITLVL